MDTTYPTYAILEEDCVHPQQDSEILNNAHHNSVVQQNP
jgi:hypothetical protein